MPRGRTSSAPNAKRSGAEFAYRPWRYLALFVVPDRRIANYPTNPIRTRIGLFFFFGDSWSNELCTERGARRCGVRIPPLAVSCVIRRVRPTNSKFSRRPCRSGRDFFDFCQRIYRKTKIGFTNARPSKKRVFVNPCFLFYCF